MSSFKLIPCGAVMRSLTLPFHAKRGESGEPGAESSYVLPADRPAAWAAMATGLAREGRSLPQIAEALCVDEPTVTRLLEQGGIVGE